MKSTKRRMQTAIMLLLTLLLFASIYGEISGTCEILDSDFLVIFGLFVSGCWLCYLNIYLKNYEKRKENYWLINPENINRNIEEEVTSFLIKLDEKNIYESKVSQCLFCLACMISYYNDKKLSRYEFKYLYDYLNDHAIKNDIKDRDIITKEELVEMLDKVKLSLDVCGNKELELELKNYIDFFSKEIKSYLGNFDQEDYITFSNSVIIFIFQLIMNSKTRLISVDDLFIMESLKENFSVME